MRLARDCGNLTLLLPDGVESIYDMPYPLFEALQLALHFLTYEELPKDERPKPEIWLEPKEMKQHWKAVDARRKAKYGGKEDSDRMGDEPIDGPVSENEAVKDIYG